MGLDHVLHRNLAYFLGAAQYPLWALTVLTLTVIMLYGLLVHWDDAAPV